MTRAISIGGVAVLAAVGVYFYTQYSAPAPQPVIRQTEEPSVAQRAEENMVVVFEQQPGTEVVVTQVYLAQPGFVVINEDANDAPGAILGASTLLPDGSSSRVSVELSKNILSGTKLHATLRKDTDGDGLFDPAKDEIVLSRMGGPIDGWFDITADAQEAPPVTI